MSEPDALQKRRGLLLEQIGKAADEIKQIDERSGPEQTPPLSDETEMPEEANNTNRKRKCHIGHTSPKGLRQGAGAA